MARKRHTAEEIVGGGLIEALQDPARLVDLLRDGGSSSANVHHVQHAAARAADLKNEREVLKSTLQRVTVRQQTIELKLSVPAVCQSLQLADRSDDTSRIITIPVQLHRRVVETRLVLQGSDDKERNFDPKLAHLVAKAHVWFEQLKSGILASIEDVAAAEKVDAGDVSRTLPLAFLAPSIVQNMLTGRQPTELHGSNLSRLSHFPRD